MHIQIAHEERHVFLVVFEFRREELDKGDARRVSAYYLFGCGCTLVTYVEMRVYHRPDP